MKKYLYLIVILVFASCKSKTYREMYQYSGYAQGTTFTITYDTNAGDLQAEIDQIITDFDKSMSLWDTSSHIYHINNTLNEVHADQYFTDVYELSEKIHLETNGAFNPCVYPLIKYWGFAKDRFHPDSIAAKKINVDSLLKYSRWGMIAKTGENTYQRKHHRAGIDFNAIAQGYTVDVIARLFDSKNVENYMIEIGGEVTAKGVNQHGKVWRIGIDKPISDSTTRVLQAIVEIDNLSIATSGSYRKFYDKDGRRYSHTIDPRTGMPVEHRLLSASVITKSCAKADAYATAFMVMGAPKTVEFVNKHPEIMVYLISDGFNGEYEVYMSPALQEKIKNPSDN